MVLSTVSDASSGSHGKLHFFQVNEYIQFHVQVGLKSELIFMPFLAVYIAFSKRKLCKGENFRIKDFDEF